MDWAMARVEEGWVALQAMAERTVEVAPARLLTTRVRPVDQPLEVAQAWVQALDLKRPASIH